MPGGGKPGPGGKGGRAAEGSMKLRCKSSGPVVRLTSTKSRRGRGSTEPARRTHAHGTIHGWWGTEMLGPETETPRRRAVARFIGSRDLIDNTLCLVVS